MQQRFDFFFREIGPFTLEIIRAKIWIFGNFLITPLDIPILKILKGKQLITSIFLVEQILRNTDTLELHEPQRGVDPAAR